MKTSIYGRIRADFLKLVFPHRGAQNNGRNTFVVKRDALSIFEYAKTHAIRDEFETT
jgi:hypothetical protein